MLTTLILALALAQEADPLKDAPDITKEQENLLKDLGDDTFLTREKASAALEKLDYKALKAYHKAAASDDAEVRQRGKRLLSKFYSVGNSKDEVPGIQGLYELKSWKLKSGKTMEVKDSDAADYYKAAGGDTEDMTERQNASNFKTRDATSRLVKDLRDKGYTREEVTEVLDKITEEGAGTNMGDSGYKKFREMQGLPEYEPWGPGLGFGLNLPAIPNPLPGLRNFFMRPRLMPMAIN
jgi:hypothetical protein